jgi:hypothetical protein
MTLKDIIFLHLHVEVIPLILDPGMSHNIPICVIVLVEEGEGFFFVLGIKFGSSDCQSFSSLGYSSQHKVGTTPNLIESYITLHYFSFNIHASHP